MVALLGYTFARVSLVLVPSVVAAVVEVFEPFQSVDSFGVNSAIKCNFGLLIE